jgi:YidC/Oxa1 family membrane protein insertase
MFEDFIIQPIFNVLALLYAVVPGHDFGIAVILFTIVVRLAMWPMLKKQLHQTKLMREIQPEIKKIKERTKGNRQKEAELLIELYKERGVNPYGSIGTLFLQLPILIGLFQGLSRLSKNEQTIIDLSYGWVQDLGWMKQVKTDISNFNESLLGLVDLTRSGFEEGGRYWPVILLAALAGLLQYYQTKQLSPKKSDARSIREILKGEAGGKQADQAEINAAVASKARYIFPVLTFFFASSVPGALALYWATGSLVAVIQQRTIFEQDVKEMEAEPVARVVSKTKQKTSNSPAKDKKKPKRRR